MIYAVDKDRETGYFSQEPYPADNIKCIGKDCLPGCLPLILRVMLSFPLTQQLTLAHSSCPSILLLLVFGPGHHKLSKNLKMSLFSCSHDNVFCGLLTRACCDLSAQLNVGN